MKLLRCDVWFLHCNTGFLMKHTPSVSCSELLSYNYVIIRACSRNQGFEREKAENRGKFIGPNLVIFCCREFEKPALCKSVSQSEATFIAYSEPIKSEHLKLIFYNGNIQNINKENRVENLQN